MGTSTSHAGQRYESWLKDPLIDEATKRELESIRDNEREIEDRFYKDLEFGTGGLRGVIGAGTNRMNRYTIRKATQGLARWLQNTRAGRSLSVVIAHDSRHGSAEFALEAALVLAANGITAKVFPSLRPTPQLSFAVRHLNADAGIVITASHNPPEYNGYKVYGADGGQLVPSNAEQVYAEIRKVASLADVRLADRDSAERDGRLVWLSEELDREYVQAVTQVSRNRDGALDRALADIRIVYTPLHGAGNRLVRMALEAVGMKQVHIVAEQEQPDPDFSTVKSPNPEEREAFELALRKAREVDADIAIGTDPDADRVGAAVKHNGDYVLLTGNQAGAVMIHYLLESMKKHGDLPERGAVVKTIVTSELGAKIAESHGLTVFNTLTGFKYIGEKMTQFERSGDYQFVFGYEESYGYLAGTYARDKDAVLASMLICEAAAYYKSLGKTLVDVLEELYGQYGHFREQLESRTYKGKEGMDRMRALMEQWRQHPPAEVAGSKVVRVLDYAQGIDDLPKENVLKFVLEDGSWFCIRPSGTEPKIKVYFAVCGRSSDDADERIRRLVQTVMSRLD